ncbi:alanine racemase [Candidatus Babeliales bacterium]|nr:alanine racemase [Candidatus Babeliales bacterium]MBP9844145.1 alanine racemase [Candidatus Babeliales bacterium]
MNTDTNYKKSYPLPPITADRPDFLQHWIELSSSAVEQNAAQFKQWLGPQTHIAAVIKSNAYGHGLIEMAYLYEQCDNIAALCVINLSEAIIIKQQLQTCKPIFVIGYLDAPYDFIIEYNLEVILYDFNIALQLNEVGKKHQQPIKVHVKFDTGMSRLGVVASQLDQFLEQLKTLDWITICGIFTHFAEGYHEKRTHEQEAVFAQIEALNYQTHASNSHGALTTKYKHYSFARIGSGLYGYLQKHTSEEQGKLKPVLSLKTKILQIKSVAAGALIGYDGLFQAPTNMTIAIIAIGYHEGLDARLSNTGSVIIHGQLAPIIGRVCMNLTIIDISKIPDCSSGQIVTLLGKEGNISLSAYDWSVITKASVYNHLTKLSMTIPKIIVE